ncbi:transposase [Thioclava kandeliae]|uniref:transposase n=1 Tax=Thioclava kandeliae TaxID=3070818 RepID=UPI00332134C5
MLGEVLGVERRRRWSDDEKLEILLEVGVGGASVTQVAQRHELTRSQVYCWRRDLKQKGLWSPDRGAVFLPVDFGLPSEPAHSPPPLGRSLWSCGFPMVVAFGLTAAWMAMH